MLCLPFLPTSDPPEHTRMRKQLAAGFGARRAWSPGVRWSTILARELVGGLLNQASADVVSTVAAPMPMRTITNVLGVAESDQAAFCRLSKQVVRITDVNLSPSGMFSLGQSFNGFRRLYAFFTESCGTAGCWESAPFFARLAADAEHGSAQR